MQDFKENVFGCSEKETWITLRDKINLIRKNEIFWKWGCDAK